MLIVEDLIHKIYNDETITRADGNNLRLRLENFPLHLVKPKKKKKLEDSCFTLKNNQRL